MTIHGWLASATNELADAMFASPRLDAEILLAHTLRKPRTYLHAHGDETLDIRHEDIANARLELRKDHVPVAYIVGHRYFYGRRIIVSPAVLIPRPESEQLVEQLRTLLKERTPTHERMVDIGTGSGCIGITAKLEFPTLEVTLLDTSRHALTVAEKNATTLQAQVAIVQSDLLANYPYTPDIVVANLPYVDATWDRSPELAHEPADALFADDGGLAIVRRCLQQCTRRMKQGGLILLEVDTRQLDAVAQYGTELGLTEALRDDFAISFYV